MLVSASAIHLASHPELQSSRGALVPRARVGMANQVLIVSTPRDRESDVQSRAPSALLSPSIP